MVDGGDQRKGRSSQSEQRDSAVSETQKFSYVKCKRLPCGDRPRWRAKVCQSDVSPAHWDALG